MDSFTLFTYALTITIMISIIGSTVYLAWLKTIDVKGPLIVLKRRYNSMYEEREFYRKKYEQIKIQLERCENNEKK